MSSLIPTYWPFPVLSRQHSQMPRFATLRLIFRLCVYRFLVYVPSSLAMIHSPLPREISPLGYDFLRSHDARCTLTRRALAHPHRGTVVAAPRSRPRSGSEEGLRDCNVDSNIERIKSAFSSSGRTLFIWFCDRSLSGIKWVETIKKIALPIFRER